MQRANLDLNDFLPVWERKFADGVYETEFDRLLRGEIHLPISAGGQEFVRNISTPLAQDIFDALVVRQRRV